MAKQQFRNMRDGYVELGKFLITRRARLTPDQFGLPDAGVRRTPGLRREEVATLAGVGTSWYTWIEQGRAENVSGEVLDAIARALQLSESERMYLRKLAGITAKHDVPTAEPDKESLAPFVNNWLPNPAYITDRYWNVVVANDTARLLFDMTSGSHNVLRNFFLNKDARSQHPYWNEDASQIVARFREQAGGYLMDAQVRTMVDQLRKDSREFKDLWDRQEVIEDSCGTNILNHPSVGNLMLRRATLDFTSRIALRMTIFIPMEDSGAEDSIAHLYQIARERRHVHLVPAAS